MSDSSAPAVRPSRTAWVWYALMLLATLLIFEGIRRSGAELTAPAPELPARAGRELGNGHSALFHVLVALTAVVVAGRIVGGIFQKFGQPQVIGEVVAGILLGPSFLGWISPAAQDWILPPQVAPHLGILAQIGVILYMFLVGLELNTELLHSRGHAAVAISHASIVAPFLLGSGLALWLYPRLSSSDVPFTVFALFLGAAMSVTAFPVLARILTDRRQSRTPLGVLALTCAATDDATAWCLLAFVVGVAQSQVGGAVLSVTLTLVYIGVMFLVVRPALSRFAPRLLEAPPTRTTLAIVLAALLLSTLATEAIGIHAIFGAFLLGAIIPHDSDLARDLIHKLEDFVSVLLLPAFFAFTGMRTEIGLVSGLDQWLICGLVIAVATLGKFGGSLAAARLTGLAWREASCLGVLMNTRGLMELIVLNIGLDLQVISPTLFAMMVLMALVTTIATTPILVLLSPEMRFR